MNLRGLLVGLGKTLKWGVILLLVLYGVLCGINAKDEAPSLAATTLLKLPETKPDSGNGYLALVGLNAPADEEILDYGTQWVDTYNAASDAAAIEKAKPRFTDAKPAFQGDIELLYDPAKVSCLDQAMRNAEDWRNLANANQLLVVRHYALFLFPRFEDTYYPKDIESPFPKLSDPSRLVVLDLIALDAAEGRIEQALNILWAQIDFDRRALLGSHSMLLSMVAKLWLRQDYALLAEIVATHSPELISHRAMLERMTEPLSIEQIRTVAVRMFKNESRFILHATDNIQSVYDIIPDKTMSFLLRDEAEISTWEKMKEAAERYYYMLWDPFFKTQATKNLSTQLDLNLKARIGDFTTERADVWIAQNEEIQRSEINDELHSWRAIYNPTGKYILGICRYSHAPYLLKLSDLIGITRLARLQVELVLDNVADTDIPARLVSNKALHDPYTGKPMENDLGGRTLYFDTHKSGKPERIAVKF